MCVGANVHCLMSPVDTHVTNVRLRRDVNMSVNGMKGLPSTDSLVTEYSTLYFGQLKLFISELEFLTPFHDQEDVVVVYGGAAPGYHIPFIMSLFPRMRFVLVDPDPIAMQRVDEDITEVLQGVFDFPVGLGDVLSRVEFHNKRLTADVDCDPATHLYIGSLGGSAKTVLFISDIRNTEVSHNKSDSGSHQRIVHDDMVLQQQLTLALCPTSSLLKFRLPWKSFTLGDGTVVDHENYPYLKCSHVRYQVYTSAASHEARIVVSKDDLDQSSTYNGLSFEMAMQNFQLNIRRALHAEPLEDDFDRELRRLKDVRYVDFYLNFKDDYDVPQPTEAMYEAWEGRHGTVCRSVGEGTKPFRLHEHSCTRNRKQLQKSVFLSSLCRCYDCSAFDHIIKGYFQASGLNTIENITTGVPRGIRYFKWMLDHAVHED